ncbi:unnamed protein product, partial [Ectocarpus sp. 12 AP-2014]
PLTVYTCFHANPAKFRRPLFAIILYNTHGSPECDSCPRVLHNAHRFLLSASFSSTTLARGRVVYAHFPDDGGTTTKTVRMRRPRTSPLAPRRLRCLGLMW